MNNKFLLILVLLNFFNNNCMLRENKEVPLKHNRVKILVCCAIGTFGLGFAQSLSRSIQCLNPESANLCNQLNVFGLSSFVISSGFVLTAGYYELKKNSQKQ